MVHTDHRGTTGMRRAPRAAGLAGIVFSLLLFLALILFQVSASPDPTEPGSWLVNAEQRRILSVALSLVPFVGIAFLWFMGAVRDRVGEQENRFIATVSLGSGVLFVAMLFTAAAVSGASAVRAPTNLSPDLLELNRAITGLLLHVYALRMAAVFLLTTSTLTFKAGIIPRWLRIFCSVWAVVLLVNGGTLPWLNLVFPLCTLLISVSFLRAPAAEKAAPA